MPTTRLKEKLSTLISTQVPEHLVQDYPTFVKFIEYYYKFLEQDQGAQELLQNARSYADVDRTIDSFLEYFLYQYANGLPKNAIADKSTFIKFARDLHKHKGSEDAFRILFRILFNEEIDFFYPNEVILKPSDGVWTRDYLLRASANTGSPFDFAGVQITGNTSNSTAIVESVLSYLAGTSTIYEIYLNPDSINGEFTAGEFVRGTKLTNSITGANTFITANLFPIVRSIDVVDGGLGFLPGQILTISGPNGSGAAGIVSSISDGGAIREIQLSNYGFGYDTKPNVTIGAPTANVSGKYSISGNVLTVRLSNNHSLVVGDNVSATFSANTLSDLNGSLKTLTVSSIPNLKTFIVSNIANVRTGVITTSNVNTNGNVSIVYTVNRFINGRYSIASNTVTALLPVEHGLKFRDNINVIFNKTDVDIYSVDFRIKDSNNVTLGFAEPHSFNVGDSINVTYDSNYTNTKVGTYVIKTMQGATNANTAIIYFDDNHSYQVGQNVNVKFGATISNVLIGKFQIYGGRGTAFISVPNSYQINDTINVSFTDAILLDDNDKIKIQGNANILIGSNQLIGTNTNFTANLKTGNVISINLTNVFTVANVVNTNLVYLTTNATSTVTAANVYIETSNLSGNITITKVERTLDLNPNPNGRRVFFNLVNVPNSKGIITISNGMTNALVNTFLTASVTSNGAPSYKTISFELPINFPNANVRGYVTVKNQDVSNIIGGSATRVTVYSKTDKVLQFYSNISSNIAFSNGLATVTTDLPGDIEDFSNTFTVLTTPHTRAITFASANANTRGNVTVYYSKSANLQANVGAMGLSSGRWLDDRGRLSETFKVQGRTGTDNRVYYQQFSYVIKSSQPLSSWREAIKKLLHPAGFEVFGEVVLDTTLNDIQNVTATANFFPIKIIGPITVDSTNITVDSTEYTADLDTVV